jgi:hypothetical protein
MFGGRGTGKPGLDRRDSVDHSEHTRRDSVSSVGSLDSDYTERVDHTSEADAYVSSSEDEVRDECRLLFCFSCRAQCGPPCSFWMSQMIGRAEAKLRDPLVVNQRGRQRAQAEALLCLVLTIGMVPH